MRLRACAVVFAVLAASAVCAPPAGAQSDTRPWAYISPFYQPKTGTSANLHFTNGDDVTANVNLRRYDAVGGLLSSTNFNVSAKGTIIAFAGANNGAQMHVEAWVNSPAVLAEILYTDAANAAHVIESDRWRVVGPERAVPAAVAGLQETMGELRPPILALEGRFDAVQSGVGALDGRFDAAGSKLDALQSGVNNLSGPVNGVSPKIEALAAENAALRKDVKRLRTDLRRLRKLIVSRLPRGGDRRR